MISQYTYAVLHGRNVRSLHSSLYLSIETFHIAAVVEFLRCTQWLRSVNGHVFLYFEIFPVVDNAPCTSLEGLVFLLTAIN